MSATSKELRYHSNSAVVGDLAYDLERELRERQLRHAGEARKEAARPQVRSLSHVRTRERQSVSPVAVVGFLAVAVMAVLVLMSYARLTMISSATVELQTSLSDLETKNVALTAKYEKMYDQNTVKEVAEAAGMTKPSSSQIYYLDLSEGDSAVVYQQKDSGFLKRLFSSLHQGIYSVVEYLD